MNGSKNAENVSVRKVFGNLKRKAFLRERFLKRVLPLKSFEAVSLSWSELFEYPLLEHKMLSLRTGSVENSFKNQ